MFFEDRMTFPAIAIEKEKGNTGASSLSPFKIEKKN
jgi:hypothetical protein